MKKIINDPKQVVSQMLQGIAKSNPDVILLDEAHVIAHRSKAPKVGLVSGGGSGHEPAHAGYVGKGMLDAAVAGNVFSSPDPERVLSGIMEADTGKGVLLVIKNYSGDVMNFTMAAELAEAEGHSVEYVVVKDDVAVPDSTYSTGRRGIAGTVFVHKIAGAMAERGASLAQVKRVAAKCIANVRSIGMALDACTLPEVGRPGFQLGEDEMELGMGIHGEPGIYRQKLITAHELAQTMTKMLFDDLSYQNSEVAVMVNGLGSTPLMELYLLYNEVDAILKTHGITVHKALVGNYMTAIDMSGCSITLLRLDDELKQLLNDPCDTPIWRQ